MINPAQTDGSGDPLGYSSAAQPSRLATPANYVPAVADTTVAFDLRVPVDAEVWFNDSKTEQTGAFRQFVSPRLTPKQAGLYDVRCRWQQNGRQLEQTRHVSVHAGERVAIKLLGVIHLITGAGLPPPALRRGGEGTG
jgi:uncharacterized protein (TIGR03000 family)